jgi:hypothetical protein
MKRSLLLAIILLSIHWGNAQVTTSQFSGEWELPSGNVFRFTNGKISFFCKKDEATGFVTARDYFENGKPGFFSESNDVNKNNAIYSWTNSCSTCRWTETHTYHFSFITSQLIRVNWTRIVNNIGDGKDPETSWHSSSPNSFQQTKAYDIRPRTLWEKSIPLVGGSSNSGISLIKLSNSAKNTMITFELKNIKSTTQSFSLHAPGTEKAFYLADGQGNRYELTGQFGFGGFKTISLDPDETLLFECYFEKLPANTRMINIKEGDCSGPNCWNFYEVSLR